MYASDSLPVNILWLAQMPARRRRASRRAWPAGPLLAPAPASRLRGSTLSVPRMLQRKAIWEQGLRSSHVRSRQSASANVHRQAPSRARMRHPGKHRPPLPATVKAVQKAGELKEAAGVLGMRQRKQRLLQQRDLGPMRGGEGRAARLATLLRRQRRWPRCSLPRCACTITVTLCLCFLLLAGIKPSDKLTCFNCLHNAHSGSLAFRV